MAHAARAWIPVLGLLALSQAASCGGSKTTCNCVGLSPAVVTIPEAQSSPIVTAAASASCGAEVAPRSSTEVLVLHASVGPCQVRAQLADGEVYQFEVDFQPGAPNSCCSSITATLKSAPERTDAAVDGLSP